MILTHGANSISMGNYEKFLFLSYFNNINTTTGVDSPIIGSAITFDPSEYSFTNSTLSYGNTSYSGLTVRNSISSPSDVIVDSMSNLDLDSFAIEFISKSTISTYPTYITDKLFLTLDDNGTEYTLNGPCSIRDKAYRCIAFNSAISWSYNASESTGVYTNSSWYLVASTAEVGQVLHQAVQFNKSSNWIKYYINGNLLLTLGKYMPLKCTRIGVGGTPNTNSLQITQLACKVGDYTTNSGANYTVPTEPYATI